MIRLIDIQKSYDNGTKALKGVNLRIDDGEFVFLVGPSGSGKSTILKLITAEIAPTGGRLMGNGYNLNNIRPRQVPYMRRTLGVIFQDFRLIEKKTVRENLTFAMRAVGASPREIRKRVPYVLELVGLDQKGDRKPNQLSGGEQQRVAIARALVNNPQMIIADEPTGNLDSTTSRQVLYSMLEMAKSYGITFVMVTHEKELAYCGDRIVTIKDGRVLDNVLLGEDEKAENRRRLFGDVTSGDIAEPETTVEEEKKPAAKQAKAVAAAVAEKVNQESM